MLQPKYAKQLDSNIKELLANGGSNEDVEKMASDYTSLFSDEALKKKDNSDVTATAPKLDSETSTGSSDIIGSNGFPAIDQNLGVPGLKPDLKTVEQLANPPKSKATTQQKETKKEEVEGFGEGLLNRLDTGIATISKSFYDAPKMILDAVYAPQNYLSEKLNIPSLKVDPETYAFENIPSKNMDEIVKNNNKKIENYKKEIGGDVVSAFDKGDYVNTFKHAALNSMESVPLIAATIATGGESLLANSLMIGSSASTQYDQLNKEHPEMGTGTKLANAAVNGALEVAVGKFMEGVGGNVWKNVLAKKGVKETAQIATNSFKKTLEKVVGDSPMVGVAGEYAEERITDGLQQLNDIATGASSDFNWDQNRNAGLSSLGFGLPNATALYSAKAYISNQTKKRVTETSKQIVRLQNDLQNPDLSPEKKKIISENISKIYDENKKIFGDELQKLEIMPEKTKKELVGIDKNIDKIKDSAIDIKYDVNISPENKALLLKNLEQDFKDNINRKNEILSKTSEVEFLPLKEQDKIKRQALKELTAELNPDGKKNIEIDNAQIVERANKIYKTQQENLIKEKDAKVEIPITETEVETEVQEPTIAEQEKVDSQPKNTVQETQVVENAEPIQESVEVESEEEKPQDHLKGNENVTFYTGRGKKIDDFATTRGEHIFFSKNNDVSNWYGGDKSNVTEANIDTSNFLDLTSQEKKTQFVKENFTDKDIEELYSDEIRHEQDRDRFNKYSTKDLIKKYKERAENDRFSGDGKIQQFLLKKIKEKGYSGVALEDSFFGKKDISYVVNDKSVIKTKDATQENGNPPANGIVQSRTSNVGENGITEQQSPAKESVPSAVDGRESEIANEVSKSEVYHGGDIVDLKSIDDNIPFFVTESDAEAIAYSKGNEGDVHVAKIDMSKIANEDVATKILTDMGYADEYMLHERIDPRFEESYIGEKNAKKLSYELEKQGYEGVKFNDSGIANKNNVTNIFLTSPKKTLMDSGFESNKIVNERKAYDLLNEGYKPIVNGKIIENITEDELGDLFVENETIRMTKDIQPKPKETENEVDYALNQIDKGILQWNGDINSPRIDLGISWTDIRKGEADLKRGKVDSVPAKRLIEAIGKSKKYGGYRYKLGTGGANMRSAEFVTFEDLQRANNEIPLTDSELEQVNRDQEQLAKEHENYFDSLDEETQIEILGNYENKIDNQGKILENSDSGKSKNDVPNEKTPSRKEKRIKVAEAKIDDFANALKDLLPSVDTNGLKKQGLSQDDIIDFIAKSAKELAKTGIEIDEAIRQVIAKLNERFEDLNVDEKLVKEKIGVDVPRDFESKPGKKSVLSRMASGNSSEIKKAIAKYSLDYEIENQKEAKSKAEMFVDEVGVDNALVAVRKGLIDGAQGAFIYARAIEILEQEINDLKGDNKLDAIADYQELLGQISDELDNRSRSNGRFIAALAEIYNSSGGRYNLTKMINDYKAQNNGAISKEVLEKLKNVEQKLKESEAKLAELEAKKRIEEENEAFNNILESVARRKRINTNAKISDKQKAQAFADKLLSYKISNRANLSAATPFSIAYDLAIDAAAKAIVATGFISDAIKAGVNSIRNSKLSKDEQEQALSDLFDLFDDSDVNTGQRGMMSVDEEGKLRIPHSLIREKVENGIDNIDDLTAALMEDAKKIFPDLDFTERQVRDIITGYGKISNPTSDEIETQISIMKSLGKIASGLEDVKKGQRPLRSGQQRRESVLKERVEMKKLKALLRDLPLADADIKKAYKTALDAIKKRLSNEIEELDEQIANGEKRKGEKTIIEYDQEVKDLKAVRDAKKAELDELVGKPELTEQQKIDRAENILQKRLDDLQQKIDANEIDYAKKPETVTSAKLEEMRKLKKEYEAQIQKMREDAGLAEERLIEIAKRNASKRLVALKERIANKDFEPRKRKPTPTDLELNKIKSEIATQKEIFDKEVYKLELKNRRIEQKVFDALKDILSVPKIMSFTSDLSFVGIQPVTQIYKMGANSLINLAKTGKLKGTFRDAMAKTFKAMASPDFEQKFMQAVKANPNYQLWKDSKLGIVESHYKESAKAEVFQHNAITTVFDILGNYVASKGYEKAGNIIKNYLNIISIFERGQTVFENQMRINRFQEGVDLLKAQGFNPVDDIQEYRKVAAAVNTLTGRANTGSKVAAALREANGTIFSSFSNWAAGFNQLNPYWYYTLTPTARKMALTDVAHHIVGAGSFLSLSALYALGQDDDDEDKVTVETSPTSSDFAVIKIGNLRIDPWAGKKTTAVAFSRLLNGGKTDKYGNFKKYGIEYGDENWLDLPIEYAGNKIAPGPRAALDRFFGTKEVEYQGNKFREDKYGVDFKESKYLIPLIFENFKEVNEEQPNLFGKAAMALSWTGLINTNVYGGSKEGFKDMPDDLVEKEYKVKIQKLKDNEKMLEFNTDKLAKEYNEKKITKFQIMQKVESLVDGDAELYGETIKSIIEKVNKEELKTLVTDPFYLGLKKEKNPEIQAILFYSKFKDDSGMSAEDKRERNKNLRFVEFDSSNPKFRKAYQELLDSKKKPVN